MSKPCEICGQEITGTGKRFCSCACRNKAIAAGRKKVPKIFSCAQCGKDFTLIYRLGSEREKQRQYCSLACRNKGRGQAFREKRVMQTCCHCGQQYYREPSALRRGSKYCSKACHVAYVKEHGRPDKKVANRVCQHCGKEFTIPQCWFKKAKNPGQYCSRDCWNKEQRARGGTFGGSKRAKWGEGVGVFTDPFGYIHEYDPNRKKFVRQHRLVMERMLGRPLEKREKVHHRNGKRGDNEPENLELVIGNHFSGKRVRDVYERDIERLALENYRLKQELQELREQLLNSRR